MLFSAAFPRTLVGSEIGSRTAVSETGTCPYGMLGSVGDRFTHYTTMLIPRVCYFTLQDAVISLSGMFSVSALWSVISSSSLDCFWREGEWYKNLRSRYCSGSVMASKAAWWLQLVSLLCVCVSTYLIFSLALCLKYRFFYKIHGC